MFMNKFDGELKNYWGKPLTKLYVKDGEGQKLNTVRTLKYDGDYEAYGVDKDEKAYLDADWSDAIAEMRSKNDFPTDKEIVQMRNAKRLAAAKANAATKELAKGGFIQPTTENDSQLRLKQAFNLYWQSMDASVRDADPVAARANARAEAAAFVKAAWEDDEE